KQIESILIDVYEETGVGLTGYVKEITENECAYEVSIGDQYQTIPKEKLQATFTLLNKKLTIT
ncbi:hypothetical protein R0J90_14215, partial [Micrococcus sp. SIMBA_144]